MPAVVHHRVAPHAAIKPNGAGRPAYSGDQPEFDFEHELPAGRENFTVRELAALWRCVNQHVFNLIESGELPVALDLRAKASSRAMIRVPRVSVVTFLNRRKDLAAMATKTRFAARAPTPTETI